MTKSRLLGAVCACISLFTTAAVHSAIVGLNYDFVDDAALSGSFSYDGSSATPLAGDLAGFTAYTPVNITVTYNSGGTTYNWDLSDYVDFVLPDYSLMPTIDPTGKWQTSEIRISPVGWAGSTFVNSDGAKLFFNSCLSNTTDPYEWCGNLVSVFDADNNLVTESHYRTSAVPLPAVSWLFGSGLLGMIGMARMIKGAGYIF